MLTPMTVFETDRLMIRNFTRSDYDNFYLLQGDPAVMKYIRAVRTRAESDAALDEAIQGNAETYLGRWAVEEKETGQFVGSFVIVPIPDDPQRIQLGYAFLPSFWGKGYASEATQGGLVYFRQHTPLTVLYAVTESPHITSQKVLLKNGFQFLETKKEGEKDLYIFIINK